MPYTGAKSPLTMSSKCQHYGKRSKLHYVLFGYGHANNGNSIAFLYSALSQQPCVCVMHERHKVPDKNQMKQNMQIHTPSILFYLTTLKNFDCRYNIAKHLQNVTV